MLTRTITAIVGMVIVIPVCLFSDTPLFVAAVTVMTVIAVYEMLHCIGAKGQFALTVPAYLLSVAVPVSVRFFPSHGRFLIVYAAVMFLFLIYLFAVAVFARGGYHIDHVAVLYVTTIYIITAFSSIILLRDIPNGQYIYLLAIAGPWVSDIFAYLVGRLFGRHKLIPEVSPKKTIEGCVGGIIFCSLFFVLYGFVVSLIFETQPEYGALLLAGVLISGVSQIGDLIASLIKRQFNIKDYGKILPGHGGVMDRFDSVLSTAPVLLMLCAIPGIFTFFF